MKRVYLVRHAKSSWRHIGLADQDRPLNKRGKTDAPVMGRRLAERGLKPDRIVTSPAKRARKTAKLLAKELGYPKDEIVTEDRVYEGGVEDLWDVIRGADDAHESLLLVGHNPDFTEMANALSEQRIDHMPTCGVLCVDFDAASWSDVSPGAGEFVFFDYPKKPG